MAFCSAQAAVIFAVRLGPRPSTSISRAGSDLDDVHDVDAEVGDHPLGHHRADALDQARAQVPLDALGGGREHGGVGVHLELLAVLRVARPPAAQPQRLAHLRAEQRADHGDQLGPPVRAGRADPAIVYPVSGLANVTRSSTPSSRDTSGGMTPFWPSRPCWVSLFTPHRFRASRDLGGGPGTVWVAGQEPRAPAAAPAPRAPGRPRRRPGHNHDDGASWWSEQQRWSIAVVTAPVSGTGTRTRRTTSTTWPAAGASVSAEAACETTHKPFPRYTCGCQGHSDPVERLVRDRSGRCNPGPQDGQAPPDARMVTMAPGATAVLAGLDGGAGWLEGKAAAR